MPKKAVKTGIVCIKKSNSFKPIFNQSHSSKFHVARILKIVVIKNIKKHSFSGFVRENVHTKLVAVVHEQ